MTLSHVSSDNKPVQGCDFRYKGKVVADVGPIVDVDVFAND